MFLYSAGISHSLAEKRFSMVVVKAAVVPGFRRRW